MPIALSDLAAVRRSLAAGARRRQISTAAAPAAKGSTAAKGWTVVMGWTAGKARSVATVLAVAGLLLPGCVAGQATSTEPTEVARAAGTKVLTINDYARWRSIGSASISPDGRWVTYAYRQREVDDSLFVAEVDGDGRHVAVRGTSPEFSPDSRWVAYFVEPEDDDEEGSGSGEGGGSGAGASRAAELLELATGATRRWENVRAFDFAEAGGALVLHKRKADREAEHDGADLVVRYLDAAFEEPFAHVGEWSLDPDRRHLAYAVDGPEGEANALHLLDLSTRARRVLDAERGAVYARLTWGEEDEASATALAALRGTDDDELVERPNALLTWRDVTPEGARPVVVDPGPGAPSPSDAPFEGGSSQDDSSSQDDPSAAGEPSSSSSTGFPEGWVLSEKGGMRWSPDASRLFVAVRPQEPAPLTLCDAKGGESAAGDDEAAGADVGDRAGSGDLEDTGAGGDTPPTGPGPVVRPDTLPYALTPDGRALGPGEILEGACPDEISDVDVFHGADERLQSQQRQSADRDRSRTFDGVVHLAADVPRYVQLTDSTMESIEITDDGRWGMGRDGRPYVSDWKPAYGDYYRVDVETGERHPVLERQLRTLGFSPDGEHFLYWKDGQVWDYRVAADEHVELTADAPASFVDETYDRFGEKPPWGVAGWTTDGDVILEHRYDLYLQPAEGGPVENLTRGVGSEREMRLRIVDLDPDEDEIDLDGPLLLSAYGEWTKKAGFYRLDGGRLEALVYADARFGTPRKAEDADRLLWTREDFRGFPDYRVSGLDFAEPVTVTEANPQQAEYRWGRRILFDYENADGVRLQGTLAIPDDYVEGERRPMMVHFYEKLSQNLHDYPAPAYRSSPQTAGYLSAGYLVMEPDVHFRIGSSHSDMLECVEAAVRKVIELGYADPDAVGLHGHSYSGGGASYIAGRSTMFSAIVAGAAPINLAGEFNILFRGSGQNNHAYDIYGQGRYATDPFSNPELYREQSPITWVETMDTPLLYLHGADDQIVEYNQGMEFYNALRFLEKPVIFLSYPGEGHGLGEYANQRDFQIRMRQFYDHHLRGVPAPRWMTEGRSFLAKERAVEAVEDGSGGEGSR